MRTCLFFLVSLLGLATSTSAFSASPPPPPKLSSLPLPVKLAGGIILFQTSVPRQERKLAQSLLRLAEQILREDPLVQMELGSGLEAGGVFASASAVVKLPGAATTTTTWKQFYCEFQLNGGNSWAQARVYGLVPSRKEDTDPTASLQIVSLQVANMDASLNGGWLEVPVAATTTTTTSSSSTDTLTNTTTRKSYQSIEEWHDQVAKEKANDRVLQQLQQNQAQWKQSFDQWNQK